MSVMENSGFLGAAIHRDTPRVKIIRRHFQARISKIGDIMPRSNPVLDHLQPIPSRLLRPKKAALLPESRFMILVLEIPANPLRPLSESALRLLFQQIVAIQPYLGALNFDSLLRNMLREDFPFSWTLISTFCLFLVPKKRCFICLSL